MISVFVNISVRATNTNSHPDPGAHLNAVFVCFQQSESCTRRCSRIVWAAARACDFMEFHVEFVLKRVFAMIVLLQCSSITERKAASLNSDLFGFPDLGWKFEKKIKF